MSSLEQILSGMEVEDYFHSDIQFKIDKDLRVISVPSNGVIMGVVGDKNVNRLNFMMKRYYDGNDMSTFTTTINYANANGNSNTYSVDDVTVAGEFIIFTWLIDSDVVAYSGEVIFTICMVKMNGETLLQSFNTSPAKGKVLSGLNIDAAIEFERIRLSEKTEFGNLVCFTDSIGQGQNNDDYSYIDILEESERFNRITKAAVGSATFGVYSGANSHPALRWGVGSSFYEQARKQQYQLALTNADNVIVQYMANDVLAILANLVEIGSPTDTGTTTICGIVKNTLDYIFNINPDVIITWISLFNSEKNISYFATAYEGFSDAYDLGYSYNDIFDTAKDLNDAMFTIFTNYNCNIMPILEGKPYNSNNSNSFFSSDNVHPNTSGHKIIAKQYLKTLRGGQEISWNEILYRLSNVSGGNTPIGETPTVVDGRYKTFTMTANSGLTGGSTNVTVAQLLSWHDEGYDIKGIANISGIDVMFNIASVFASQNYITLSSNVMAINTANAHVIFVAEIFANNSFSGLKAFNLSGLEADMSQMLATLTNP